MGWGEPVQVSTVWHKSKERLRKISTYSTNVQLPSHYHLLPSAVNAHVPVGTPAHPGLGMPRLKEMFIISDV